jgi:hypothetical protein
VASHLAIPLPGGYTLRDHSTNDLVRVEIRKSPRPALFLAQCANGKWNIGREWPVVETYRLEVSERNVEVWLRLHGYPSLDLIFDSLEEMQ